MRRGDLRTAWAIADAALAARSPAQSDDPALPYHQRWVWDGRDLTGRAVVVRCYHGLGDTLQFACFLPALRARASHVTLEAQPELCALFAQLQGVNRLVPFDAASPIPATDAIEIMELQHALRLGPQPPASLCVRKAPLPAGTAGACWQSGSWDTDRSIPLPLLRKVLPAEAISLQRGASGLPDPLGGSMDIAATAGLIAALDQVVSVDTMVAHLAGVLRRPLHILLKADADWRWGEGAATPWYPTATLHRQRQPGDWQPALESLALALA